MAGTWTSQNKILPGAYLNFRVDAPLSITPGDRGTVVILQEMSKGSKGDMYEITAKDQSKWPADTPDSDKLLTNEALKGANKVIVYNLGSSSHVSDDLDDALGALMTVDFDVLVYPFDGEGTATNKATIKTWVKSMRDDEGRKIQAVMANYTADDMSIINVTQGVKLADGTTLDAKQATAWVGGITAGAAVNQSNTGRRYEGAVDVVPRMTRTEMESAVEGGEFVFKVDTAQNVTVLYDINSLTSVSGNEKMYRKNRVVRTLDGINNDITKIFESNYIGKVNNNPDGRSLLRATLIEYFSELQRLNAIQNFTAEDVTVTAGTDSDAVVIDCYIQPVDSVEKIYITVNLS